MTRSHDTPSLGLLPFFDQRILDRSWVEGLVRLAEDAGVESLWTVEHVIFADDYEPLYPYSETGEAPAAPDTTACVTALRLRPLKGGARARSS